MKLLSWQEVSNLGRSGAFGQDVLSIREAGSLPSPSFSDFQSYFFQKDLCRGLLWNLDQVFGQSGEPIKSSELCARPGCETDIDIVTDSPPTPIWRLESMSL